MIRDSTTLTSEASHGYHLHRATSVSPVVILAMLERARAVLDLGEPTVGRAFVVDAIHRLEAAKQAQDTILEEEARTPERPGTTLDLAAD